MSVNLFGRRVIEGIDIKDITVDDAAKFVSEMYPDIWKRVNVKFIEPPGTHYGFKAAAVCLAGSIAEMTIRRKDTSAANNLAACAAVLQQHNYPTYYVSRPLLDALLHTSPPANITWDQLKLPFPGVMFMLPKGVLHEPDYISYDSGIDVVLIGIAKFAADRPLPVLGTNMTIKAWHEDRLSVFWSLGNCLVSQDCTFPLTQMLEPDPGYIARKTEQYRTDRQHHIEAGGKFTELDWRAGHFKRQHFGKSNKEEKIIWVDPYIAYVRGLVV